MSARSHPYINPFSGAFASYIDVDPLYSSRNVVDGFETTRSDQMIRYTPITVSQEEIVYHRNINYEERGLQFPRFVEQMFHNSQYQNMFRGAPTAPFRVKFIEDPASKVKVLIGVTMYQEPCSGLNDIRKMNRSATQDRPENFAEQASHSGGVPGTMVGILMNIQEWVKCTNYKWDEICVCLLADGRTRINGQYNNLQALARMGVYVDLEDMYRPGGLMDIHGRLSANDRMRVDSVSDKACSRDNPRFTVDDGQPVYVHLFENVIYYEDYPPMQFMFCLKEFNAGKLDTHLWFFEGFAHHMYRVMNERSAVHEELYCVCIDAGTRPKKTSIVKLISELEYDSSIAGVCGEIEVDKNLHPKNILYNWTVAAQNFEYKLGNLMDKCCESSMGFITVLPGAFSAYRWSALSPPELDPSSSQRPIVPYFKSVTHGGEMSAFFGNMYLAEDRVLCLELVCSPFGSNVLSYVEGAPAVTDVPDNTAALTKQRRRWLNGSFFAQVYAIWQGLFQFRLFRTGHSIPIKFLLLFEFLYLMANTVLVWFLPGLFYLSFTVLWRGFLQEVLPDIASVVFLAAQSLYLFMIFTTLILAMGTPPDSPRRSIRFLYGTVQFGFGILMLGTFAISIRNIVITKDWVLTGLGILNTAVYFVAAFLHGELHHVVFTFLQYIYMQPTYVNVFQIFAFANTHDLSWGTKGLDSDSSAQKNVLARRLEFRTFLVIGWSISNMLGVFIVNSLVSFTTVDFMKVLLFVTLGFNAIRFLGSCMYLLQRLGRCLCSCNRRKHKRIDKQKQLWEQYRQDKNVKADDWRKGTPYDPTRRRKDAPTREVTPETHTAV
jgi:chitin synthase